MQPVNTQHDMQHTNTYHDRPGTDTQHDRQHSLQPERIIQSFTTHVEFLNIKHQLEEGLPHKDLNLGDESAEVHII